MDADVVFASDCDIKFALGPKVRTSCDLHKLKFWREKLSPYFSSLDESQDHGLQSEGTRQDRFQANRQRDTADRWYPGTYGTHDVIIRSL